MQKYLGIVAHPPVAERGDVIVTSLRVSEVFNLSSAGSTRILTVNQVFDRLGRREARRDRTTSALRRLQSAAVDRAIEISEEAALRSQRADRRR